MTLWIFTRAKEKKRTATLHDLQTLLRTTIRSDVDTSMFSLVRDYRITTYITIFSKNYQVLWESRCNGTLPCNSVCQDTQWMIHFNWFNLNLHTTDVDAFSFAEARRSQSLLMPTICCCGSCEPAETICPKKSSPDHWCCKDTEIIVTCMLILCKDFAWWDSWKKKSSIGSVLT
jgi:hypothetical protein